MDPKVGSKLLTLHRRGYGVDVDAPSGGAPEQAPRWDLVDTESCGGGIRFLAPYLICRGYVVIYRRQEYVGEATRGPRGRGRALGGAPPTLVTASVTSWSRVQVYWITFGEKITSPKVLFRLDSV